MGFDWEQAAGVSDRGGEVGRGHLRLASADGGGDGGSGSAADLRIGKTPWSSAAGVADELRTSTGSGLADLEEASTSVAGGTAGFGATSALDEIRATWEARLTSVRDECGRLHGTLGRTGKHFGEVDHRVGDSADGVRVGDTPEWAR